MAAEERLRFSTRTALHNIVRLIPAVVIMAATLNTLSCGDTGFLGSATNSASPTSTSTSSGSGALAFVTNFNDGMVSSFTRDVAKGTGALKRTGQIKAGPAQGPKGLAAYPTGNYLYVANSNDGNIYQYAVNQTNGTLTQIAVISNNKNSGPDEIAIIPAGNFLYVTGFKDGSVTGYSINASNGQLTKLSTRVTGLVHPFGIAADPTSSFIYVADNGAGLVYSYNIAANGTLTQNGLPVFDLGSAGGTPGFIAVNPSNTFIYVTDLNAGQLSVLGTSAGQPSFGSLVPSTTTGNVPIGIGYAVVSAVGNFLFTANQGSNGIWSFQLPTAGFPAQPVEFGTGNLNAPTGLVVDPQGQFLYTTNQNAGTVSQFSLSSTCFAAGAPCFVSSIFTESPSNANSGPFGITLAQ
jgi:6-phosphogluconolactonase (cycloisomerase 2 family)